jgi:type VI secretion system protein ImpG
MAHDYEIPESRLLKTPWLLKVGLHSKRGSISALPVDHLRFYLGGDILTALTLFRWIHSYDPQEPVPIFLQTHPQGPLCHLARCTLKKVGFEPSQTLIPGTFRLAPAYRLLLEFFTLVQKFLYVQLDSLRESLGKVAGDTCNMYFALGQDAMPSKWPLSQENVMLGCIPAVNLFEKTLEPIHVNHERLEYRLSADYGREDEFEIHSVLKVAGTFDVQSAPETYAPYFAYGLQSRQKHQTTFWLKRRARTVRPRASGTEVFLSFVDNELDLSQPPDKTLYVQALCTNRGLAQNLPVNGALEFEGEFTGVHVRTLDRPTRSLTPPIDGKTQWRLIRHLTLDHLGVCGKEGTVAPLRELFSLYNFGHHALEAAAQAIQSVAYEETVGRVGRESWRGFVPMLSVSLIVEDLRANTQGALLLSEILHEIFKMSAGFNTLVETKMIGQSNRQVIKKWHPEPCIASLI